MSPEQVSRLNDHLDSRSYDAGEEIYAAGGTETDEMLLIASGSISLFTGRPPGEVHRIAALSAGMTLNEIAMISRQKRIATSRTDTEVIAWALNRGDLRRLREEDPDLVGTLMENFIKMLAIRAEADRAVAVHDLTVADAFQLAAAIAWRASPERRREFISLDRQLAERARREGIDCPLQG